MPHVRFQISLEMRTAIIFHMDVVHECKISRHSNGHRWQRSCAEVMWPCLWWCDQLPNLLPPRRFRNVRGVPCGGGCNVWGKRRLSLRARKGNTTGAEWRARGGIDRWQVCVDCSFQPESFTVYSRRYVTVEEGRRFRPARCCARRLRSFINVMAAVAASTLYCHPGTGSIRQQPARSGRIVAAIAYKVDALWLNPRRQHYSGWIMQQPYVERSADAEPELLREFLGDPAGRIKAPTVAQEMLFGAKGRVFQLQQYLARRQTDLAPGDLERLKAFLDETAEDIEQDNAGALLERTLWLDFRRVARPMASAMDQRV